MQILPYAIALILGLVAGLLTSNYKPIIQETQHSQSKERERLVFRRREENKPYQDAKVRMMTLEDGTRCVVFGGSRGGIDCAFSVRGNQ